MTKRKMARTILACAALVYVVHPSEIRANFIDAAVGARPLSMGKAFVAVADDANAIYWNPAGLSQIEGIELTGTRLWAFGVNDFHIDYIAVKFPRTRLGHFGIGWLSAGLEEVLNENTFIVSYGKNVWRTISLGANVKYLRVDAPGYENYRDPAYEGAVGQFSFDVGFLMKPTAQLSLGFSAMDINEPELKMLRTTRDGDRIGRDVRLGMAYVFRKVLNFTLDIATEDGDFSHRRVGMGGEFWFYDSYAFRVGSDGDTQAFGAGVKAARWRVDFAFANHPELDNSYRLSFTLRR